MLRRPEGNDVLRVGGGKVYTTFINKFCKRGRCCATLSVDRVRLSQGDVGALRTRGVG